MVNLVQFFRKNKHDFKKCDHFHKKPPPRVKDSYKTSELEYLRDLKTKEKRLTKIKPKKLISI